MPSMIGDAACTRPAGRDAARHEVVADGHEELRLVGLEGQRDDAVAQHAAEVLGERLELLHRVERRGIGEKPRPVDCCALRASSAGCGAPPPPARRRLLELRCVPAAPRSRSGRRSADSAPAASVAAVEQSDARLEARVGPASPVSASMRRMPRADGPFAGDHEAADLARRAAVGAAAQLEAVALDADRRAPSRRTSRRRTRRRPRSMASAIGMNSRRDRPVVADHAREPRPRSPLLVVGQGRSNGKSKRR